MLTSDCRPEVELWPFSAASLKIRNITLIYGEIADISASYRKSGSRNTMVTSDFKPEVEIWPVSRLRSKIRNIALVIGTTWSLYSCYEADITFTACVSSSIKNQLKAPSNRRNFAICKEIGVKESNADVRIYLSEPSK